MRGLLRVPSAVPVNIFEPGHGDPIWKSNDVKGRTLTRAIERRIASQIQTALSGDSAQELKRIVVQTRGRVAAEDAIMPMLEERFGNRLCYGTVRRLVDRYYLSQPSPEPVHEHHGVAPRTARLRVPITRGLAVAMNPVKSPPFEP